MSPLAERLTELIHRRGMSITEVARRSGVDRVGLHQILNGATRNPRVKTIQKLASVLHVTASELGFADLDEDVEIVARALPDIKQMNGSALHYGWICPRCDSVYAPTITECASCNQNSRRAT